MSTPQITTPEQTDALHRIIDTGLYTKPSAPLQILASNPISTSLPPELPLISCVAADLRAHGAPQSLANRLSDSYRRHANQLRQQTEIIIRELIDSYNFSNEPTSSIFLERPIALYVATYHDRLNKWKAQLVQTVQTRVAPSGGTPHHDTKLERSTFNTEYVPFLETYLKHNAFPSAADRALLARKSGNTPRQIEIWFQNRRRRLRKAGILLKRLRPDELPFDLHLDGIEKQIPSFISREKRRSTTRSLTPISNAERSPSPQATPSTQPIFDFLKVEPPLYAFPAKYDKHASQFSWSTPPVFQFPQPDWSRKPTPRRTRRTVICSDEELSLLMAEKLRIFSKDKSPNTQIPWYAARYTYPSRAPLPCLVTSPINPKHPLLADQADVVQSSLNTVPLTKPSLKRILQESDERLTKKQRRSVSASSSISISSCNTHLSELSAATSEDSSTPGPQTPPTSFASLPHAPPYLYAPRSIDWSKFKIPLVPMIYGLC